MGCAHLGARLLRLQPSLLLGPLKLGPQPLHCALHAVPLPRELPEHVALLPLRARARPRAHPCRAAVAEMRRLLAALLEVPGSG